MRACPHCGSTYGERIDFCFRDGMPLELAPEVTIPDPIMDGPPAEMISAMDVAEPVSVSPVGMNKLDDADTDITLRTEEVFNPAVVDDAIESASQHGEAELLATIVDQAKENVLGVADAGEFEETATDEAPTEEVLVKEVILDETLEQVLVTPSQNTPKSVDEIPWADEPDTQFESIHQRRVNRYPLPVLLGIPLIDVGTEEGLI